MVATILVLFLPLFVPTVVDRTILVLQVGGRWRPGSGGQHLGCGLGCVIVAGPPVTAAAPQPHACLPCSGCQTSPNPPTHPPTPRRPPPRQNLVLWAFLGALLWTFRMRQGSPYLLVDEEMETGGWGAAAG